MAVSPIKAKQAEEPHDLYIVSDEHGRVIYVGLSWNAIGRIYSHRSSSPWGRAWATITLRSFPTRHEAEQFERALIEHYKPAFNKANHGNALALAAPTSEALNAMMDAYVLWRRAAYGPNPARLSWPDRPPSEAELKSITHCADMAARHAFACAR